MAEQQQIRQIVFISRAGEDSEVARHVAETLKEAGYETFLQDEDFGHTSFMQRMAEGFDHVDRGGCLLALVSEAYQRKPHCLKEARYPLIADPFNVREKLVVLRVDGTSPRDFLKDIPYVDLDRLSPTDAMFDEEVIAAVERSFSAQRPSTNQSGSSEVVRLDAKVEKLMTFLENEDSEEPGKAMLAILILFSAIALALFLFEQALSAWNWLFETSYYAIFDASFVIEIWFLVAFGMLFAALWHVRTAARTIEDAHLKISQLKDLRSRAAAQTWKSDWFVKAVIQTATRNITSRK